jgi:hypothetical protein
VKPTLDLTTKFLEELFYVAKSCDVDPACTLPHQVCQIDCANALGKHFFSKILKILPYKHFLLSLVLLIECESVTEDFGENED